jgi:hypothetical protein
VWPVGHTFLDGQIKGRESLLKKIHVRHIEYEMMKEKSSLERKK